MLRSVTRILTIDLLCIVSAVIIAIIIAAPTYLCFWLFGVSTYLTI